MPLKNIAEPMRAYSLEVGAPSRIKAAAPADQRKSLTAPKTRLAVAPLAAGIVALVLLVAAGGWYMLGGRLTKPAQAAHLSIVVLPFANLSGDPAQDYFADGITENLTTELSRIKDSFVIARNTAFTFKGKNVDAKQIGKELGVRYVLEGSVQRDQNRVRVNAQLVDADSGAHLWAQRFEEDLADLFKLQDQVVTRLANTLGNELTKAEAAKGARSTNPDANDLVMRGWALDNEQSFSPARTRTMRSGLCLNRRSRSIPTMPRRSTAWLNIFNEHIMDGKFRDRLRRQNTRSVRPRDRSRSGLRRIVFYEGLSLGAVAAF